MLLIIFTVFPLFYVQAKTAVSIRDVYRHHRDQAILSFQSITIQYHEEWTPLRYTQPSTSRSTNSQEYSVREPDIQGAGHYSWQVPS